MSLFSTFFQSSSDGIDEVSVHEFISAIRNGSDISTNMSQLREVSVQYTSLISKVALPVIFEVFSSTIDDDEIVSEIFGIFSNILNDITEGSDNANLFLEHDTAVPLLLECMNTENPKKRSAVIQILTRLAILQPVKLQKEILRDQDKLVHLLTAINDENPMVVTNFLIFIPILVFENKDLQQIVAFNVMEQLVLIVQSQNSAAMSALRSILSNNPKTQSLFFQTNQLSVLTPLLESADQEAIALFLELMNNHDLISFKEGPNTLPILIGGSLAGNNQMLLLLSLCIKGNQKLCEKLFLENDFLGQLVDVFNKTSNIDFINTFFTFSKCFMHNSDENPLILSQALVKVENINEKVIDLATSILIISPPSKLIFIHETDFFQSIISNLLQNIYLESIIHFMIAICFDSNTISTEIISNSPQIVPFILDHSHNDEEPLIIVSQCYILLNLLGQSDEKIDSYISDFSAYLSTQEKSEWIHFLIKVTNNILHIQEEEPIQQIEEDIIIPEEQLQEINNVEEKEKEKVIEEEDELDKAVEIDKKQLDQLISNHKETVTKLEDDIYTLRDKVSFLENTLDQVTAKSQEDVTSLKQALVRSEIEHQTEISHLKNDRQEKLMTQFDELHKQCQTLKRELSLMKSQQKSLFNDQLDEIREQQANSKIIAEENRQLKFRISQLQQSSIDLTEYEPKDDSQLIQSMRMQIENHKQNEARLKQQIANLNQQNSQLQSNNLNLEQLQHENYKLKNDIHDSEERNKSLNDRLTKLQDDLVVHLNDKTNPPDQRLWKLEHENQMLNNQIKNMQNSIDEMKENNSQLKENLSQAQITINSMRHEAQSALDNLRNEQRQSQITRDKFIQLQEKNDKLEQNLTISQNQNRTIANDLTKEREQVELFKQQLSVQCHNNNTLTEQVKNLQDQNKHLLERNRILENKILEFRNKPVDNTSSKLDELEQKFTQKQQPSSNINYKAKIQRQKAEISKYKNEYLALLEQNKALLIQIKDLNASLAENPNMAEQVMMLRTDLERERNLNEQLMIKVKQFTEEKSKIIEQNSLTVQQLRFAMANLKENQIQNQNFQRTISVLHQQNKELKMKIAQREFHDDQTTSLINFESPGKPISQSQSLSFTGLGDTSNMTPDQKKALRIIGKLWVNQENRAQSKIDE